MSYLKREKTPKNWPIRRKGTTYVVRPNSNVSKGVPILIILRELLEAVQNRKEAKKAIYLKQIVHNNKIIRDERDAVLLFDTITFADSRKNYRFVLSEKGKFIVEEINESEANNKIAKIIDKKILRGKKIQINLSDGRNFLTDIKCQVNDSVLINFKEKKIEKIIPLEEKAKIIVIKGKHTGEKGLAEKIIPEKKIVEVEIKGEKVNILIKQLMVIE